jgi:hypothetical protein
MEFSIPIKKKIDSNALFTILSIALFLLLLILILTTFQSYGISWDEPVQHSYAQTVLRYYTSLFQDKAALSAEYSAYYYGAFYEVLAELFHCIVPIGIYESRHLFYALTGILGVWGCWKLVRALVNPAAAFWTAVLLILYPSYYGHMFINSKDIPFAVLYIWSLYYLLRFLNQFPNIEMGTLLKLGLTIGFAMGTRVGGMILLSYCYVFGALRYFNFWISHKNSGKTVGKPLGKMLLALLAVSVLAYAVMLIFWPYGMSKPLNHPFHTLQLFSQQVAAPPFDYIPKYLALKLPEYAILLLGLSLWLVLKAYRNKSFAQLQPYFLLVYSAAFPVIFIIVKRSSLYDEIRHLLFIIPPLFCLLGITFYYVCAGLLKNKIAPRIVFPLMGVYVAYHIDVMARLHPYEYMYYNQIAGGVRGANQRGYEMDYWGTSYREIVQNLVQDLQKRYGDRFYAMRYQMLAGPPTWSVTHYFPPQFIETLDPLKADFYISMTHDMAHTRYGGKEWLRVQRMGVPLAEAILLNEKRLPPNPLSDEK